MTRNTAKLTHTAAAAKASAKPQAESNKPEVTESELFEQIMSRYGDAQDSLLKFLKAPSWKRTLVAFVTSIAIGGAVGWAAGHVLTWMLAGAVMMSAPMFVTLLVYILGVLAAIYYGGKLAARIGGAILTGEADERAVAAYDATVNALKRLNPFAKRELKAA